MTLRRKTLMTVGMVFFGLVIILYFVSQALLMRSFTQLEEQRTRQNVEQALNALSNDILTMKTVSYDWAVWDDTYAFIEDVNQNYIETNLVAGTFTELRLNLMLFINSSGQMVYRKAFDLHNKREMAVPQSLLRYLTSGSPLVSHSDLQSIISGIILLPENPLLIVSSPILTSEEKGPIHGTLIIGRYLDASEIKRLVEQTLLSLTIHRYDYSAMPSDFQAVLPFLSQKTPVLVRPLDEQSIAGYALIRDVYNKPILLLRVDMPRDIYAQGQDTVAYFILSLLVVGLVLGMVMMLFLDKQVLFRLTQLSQGVGNISVSGDLAVRLPATGEDELSNLGGAINVVLETLEQSSDLLKRKNEQLDAQNVDLQSQAEELTAQQQELIEKTREVEEANQLKSEFLANMSHELRTPLNVIIGFSQLMAEEVPGQINEEQRRCLNDVLDSSQHLLNLINDVLDLSRVESGKVELKPTDIALAEVIASLTKTMMSILAPREQSLDIEIKEGLPLVHTDKAKLRQVLLNLVDNSSKFTPDGGKLKIEVISEGNCCWVSVIDNGIGIKEEDQERIFEPFCRLDSPLVRERGGTGLGLSLVKQIVERYGGQIWLKSELGKGSCFTFTVPLSTSG